MYVGTYLSHATLFEYEFKTKSWKILHKKNDSLKSAYK